LCLRERERERERLRERTSPAAKNIENDGEQMKRESLGSRR
jgi:hypothetical protein